MAYKPIRGNFRCGGNDGECGQIYNNASKPPNCYKCNRHIGNKTHDSSQEQEQKQEHKDVSQTKLW